LNLSRSSWREEDRRGGQDADQKFLQGAKHK
jgi:hypothetical protein